MTKKKYLSFGIIILITFLASGIGGVVTSSFKEPWYSQLILPSFNPPSWVFGPVWTTLYVLMSVAAWRVWITSFETQYLKIYFLHIFFNSIWSIFFFGFHSPLLALLDLIIILFFIVYLMIIYLRINSFSFYLMIPYLIWSFYALILNTSIVFLNN